MNTEALDSMAQMRLQGMHNAFEPSKRSYDC